MEYVDALKTLTMDQLYASLAVNAVVDMWKYSMIAQEIERRKS